MDLSSEAVGLQREIAARPKRTRFSPELAARIRVHVATRRAHGTTMQVLAEDLGIALDTLYRWQREEPRGPAVRRVEVVDGPRHIVVHGPCGVRVDGLALDDLAALLRKLA